MRSTIVFQCYNEKLVFDPYRITHDEVFTVDLLGKSCLQISTKKCMTDFELFFFKSHILSLQKICLSDLYSTFQEV